MRSGLTFGLVTVALAAVVLGASATNARAATAPPSSAAPTVYSADVRIASAPPTAHGHKHSNGHCSVGQLALNILNPFSHCQPLNQVAQTILHLPGTVASAAASGVMDQVTTWMVQAARTISGWVVKEAGAITHPDLSAGWYLNLFKGLAALGAALAGLVALVALGSAAVRKDPDALGEVVYGIGRAGIGTSVVVALTVIALTAADAISNEFARQMPSAFYSTLASQWGGSGWGGFGAAALAFLVAFVATIAGLLVWLELIVREAAIYLAVLFFPVALAASIWPSLRMWVRRLGMLLLMFVMLRPVVVIVLGLAGSVTSAGLSFGNGSIPHSVGTILAGVVIFALAGFTPWALMFLLGTEVGAMNTRAASRTGSSSMPAAGTRVGGAITGAKVALAGGGEVPASGAASSGEQANGGGHRGLRLPSLGGSGEGGGRSVGGSVAAAAGWMGGVAGAVGRTGGHIAQHAASQVHVAAGRGGVAPGGVLPPSEGGPDARAEGSSGRGDAPSSSDGGGSRPDPPSPIDSGPPSFGESVGSNQPVVIEGGDPTPAPQPPAPDGGPSEQSRPDERSGDENGRGER